MPMMSDQLSDADIEQGLKACAAATKPPWTCDLQAKGTEASPGIYSTNPDAGYAGSGGMPVFTSTPFWSGSDGSFVVLARTLLPAALQELRRLRQKIAEQARQQREEAKQYHDTAESTFGGPEYSRCRARAVALADSAAALDSLLGGTEHE